MHYVSSLLRIACNKCHVTSYVLALIDMMRWAELRFMSLRTRSPVETSTRLQEQSTCKLQRICCTSWGTLINKTINQQPKHNNNNKSLSNLHTWGSNGVVSIRIACAVRVVCKPSTETSTTMVSTQQQEEKDIVNWHADNNNTCRSSLLTLSKTFRLLF